MPDVPSPLLPETLPGPYIRRLQQIAVALFLQETDGFGITAVQYGALLTVSRQPGLDQRTLAGLMGLDTSTTAGVVDRLDSRGLLRRSASPTDKRVKLLSATPEGQVLLADIEPHVLAAQDRIILAPLSEADRPEFMRMLCTLVNANNDVSRAPADGQKTAD
jgi:DNA-binding MarR family transcriptional regulator